MKKFKFVSIFLTIFLLGMVNVRAECSMEETSKLGSLAMNVKADYEVVTKEISMDGGYNPPDGLTVEELENYKATSDYFRIHVYNITEELYVEVKNNATGDVKRFTYQDVVNNKNSFDVSVSREIVDYTVTVYSSDKTNCPGKKLSTMPLITPMYNPISESELCQGLDDYYLCHKYLSVKTDFENYERLINDYRKAKENKKGEGQKDLEAKENIFTFIMKNKGVAIASVVFIMAVGGLVTVIIVKKQRSRVI